MPGRMEFSFASPRSEGKRIDDGRPFRMLLVGDFSHLPAAERPPLGARPTHRVDGDNFKVVLRRLAPRLELAQARLEFASLDDFHPDSLYRRLPLFQALREARHQPPPSGSELMQGLLGGAPEPAAPASGAPAGSAAATVEALIRGIVAPHAVPDTRIQNQAQRAALDAASAEPLRALLHEPGFQALESSWRGVRWLIDGLELDEGLQLHLLDVSRDELLADLVAARGQLPQTGLYRALIERHRGAPDETGWSALVGLYRFGPSVADIGLLAALGLLAAQAGAPWLAGGDTLLANADAPGLDGWQALRASAVAPWIGLAAPRLLLRLPYGQASDPIESLAFEEFTGTPGHEQLLWGSGALAVALLIARAFSARGWDFEPGDEREIRDLPAYAHEQDGEQVLQACAEHYLGEQQLEAMLAAGLMPLASHRHANAVTVPRMQSIALPPTALAGFGRSGN